MEKLYLGVGREDITPEVGGEMYGYLPDVYSEGIADNLEVTAYYFMQGEKKALMVSATVCGMKTTIADSIRSAIEENFGIPKNYIMLHGTHTHSGPNLSGELITGRYDEKYVNEIFTPGLLAAVKRAVETAVPVKVGVGKGESMVGVNRRQKNDKGEIVLGQDTTAPYDPRMVVLSFQNEQGKCTGNIIFYTAHGSCAGVNRNISRDWSGFMTDALSEKTGAPTAFFNGAEGDIGPRLSNGRTTGRGDFAYVIETGEKAAKDALAIFDTITEYKEAALFATFREVHLPLRPRITTEEAEVILKNYENPQIPMERCIKSCLLDIIESNKAGKPHRKTTSFGQTAIGIGDTAFVSFPHEPFCEIALSIDAAFPDKTVLALSNINGEIGYFATEKEKKRGGYEINMCIYRSDQDVIEGADQVMIQESIETVKQLGNWR